MDTGPAYGHWLLVTVNSIVLLVFAFSFFRPRTQRDWRTFGTFGAFVVALFVEMYGFPLSIYFLSGWLVRRYPEVDWFSHDASHLLQTLTGWRGDAHIGPLHLVSNLLILGGMVLLVAAWRVLYRAQRSKTVAVEGPYAVIRHPQYAAFILIMLGFLIQWPTLPTILMFPILLMVYFRLSVQEENYAKQVFGEPYIRYAKSTPRFIPRFHAKVPLIGQP